MAVVDVLDHDEQPKAPKSWKVGRKTRDNEPWSYNGQRYKTREDALKAGEDLFDRWTALKAFEVQPSDDEPNR